MVSPSVSCRTASKTLLVAWLVEKDDNEPSQKGPLVYLSVEGRMDAALAEVEQNNGKAVSPKHSIGPHGFRAIIIDSEGNKIALHSHTE